MRRSLTEDAERTITTPSRVSVIIAASNMTKRKELNPGGFAEMLTRFFRFFGAALVFTVKPRVFPVVKLLL